MYQKFIKRFFDLFISLIFLPILIPIFILISILIKFYSYGSIFYRGFRVGKNGKMFRIIKFRTMIPDADKVGGPTTALNDSRITNIGSLLRKYKLDELPQIINVIKGEMSIVGPRPELLKYSNKYKGEEKKILSIRPGITDYSSIKFSSLDQLVGEVDANKVFNETIMDDRTELRLKYVKEHNFWVDFKLILITIGVIIKKLFNK